MEAGRLAAKSNPRKAFNLTPDVHEYLMDIFGADKTSYVENVVVWSKYTNRWYSRDINYLRDYKSAHKFFSLSAQSDLYFSKDMYRPYTETGEGPKGNPYTSHVNTKQNNLFRINAWGIDIDYRHSGSELWRLSPLEMYACIEDALRGEIPTPNYIEFGYQLRLVYILDEPISAAIKSGKALTRALKKIARVITDRINDELDCFAELQKEYFRVPGSINSKDGSIVQIQKMSEEKYTVQELIEEYLPAWIPAKKNEKRKKKSSKRNSKRINGIETLQKRRMQDFETLRSYPGIPREKLSFFYINAWAQLHPDADWNDASRRLTGFNAGFPMPLKEKELKSKLRTTWDKAYRYKDITIIQELGLDEETCRQLGLFMHTDARTVRREERAARKARQADELYTLYRNGYTSSEIAERTGMKEGTVRDNITAIRSQMTEREKASVLCARKTRRISAKAKEMARRSWSAKTSYINRLVAILRDLAAVCEKTVRAARLEGLFQDRNNEAVPAGNLRRGSVTIRGAPGRMTTTEPRGRPSPYRMKRSCDVPSFSTGQHLSVYKALLVGATT